MNQTSLKLADDLVGSGYVASATNSKKQRENLVKILLSTRKMPQRGWDDQNIQLLLYELSALDSNNFVENAGVGEREGRIYSSMVRDVCFGLAHGMGRSGDVTAVQPKAAGSSLLVKIANFLALDSIQVSGIRSARSAIVLPVATGMGILLTLLHLKSERPNAKYVVWPRMDQKSALKAVFSAALEPIVVPLQRQEGTDQLITDVSAVEKSILDTGADNVLCVLTTTSTFAPRTPDNLPAVAEICRRLNVPHIVNNAYGLQSTLICKLFQSAVESKPSCKEGGRIDAFIQSTDKNFMVPVGGSIIAGFLKPKRKGVDGGDVISGVSKIYPGRASSVPILHFVITVLSMGRDGYEKILSERKTLYQYYRQTLDEFFRSPQCCLTEGDRMLNTPKNDISFAFSVSSLSNPTEIGSMLFHRNCSGSRAVTGKDTKTIGSIAFQSYGAHFDDFSPSYMNVAASIGGVPSDLDLFLKRLTSCVSDQKKREANNEKTKSGY